MSGRWTRFAAIAAIAAACCVPQWAAAANEPDLSVLHSLSSGTDISPVPGGFMLGIAAIRADARYVGEKDSSHVVPGFVYLGKRLQYLGDRLNFFLGGGDRVQPYIYARFRFSGLDPASSPALSGMSDRGGELDAGVGGLAVTPVGLFSLRVGSDISGRSRGQDATLTADAPLLRGRLLFMPGIAVTWRSNNLSNYYYGGVLPGDVAAGRPAYDTGATLAANASLFVTYRMSRRWLIATVVAYEHFSSATAHSPTIGHDHEVTGLLAVGYCW